MAFHGLKGRRNKRKRKEMLADYIMYKATKLLAGSCEKRQCIQAVNVATIKGSRQTRIIKFDMAEMSSCKKHTKNDITNEQAITYNILPYPALVCYFSIFKNTKLLQRLLSLFKKQINQNM
jgi:hypothetical protein